MFDKSVEVKHKLITFAIREDQEMEFLAVYLKIEELLDDNKKVPAAWLKRLLSLIHDPAKVSNPKFEIKVRETIDKYYERFKHENEAFLFAFQEEIQDPDWINDEKDDGEVPKVKAIYSWDKMISNVTFNYLQAGAKNKKLHEDLTETLRYFTRELNDYLRTVPESIKSQMKLSYRRAVVGWLCMTVRGFKIVDFKNPTIKQIAAKARYAYDLEMAKAPKRKLTAVQSLLNAGKKYKFIPANGFSIAVPKR
jgi:hypothetical protein